MTFTLAEGTRKVTGWDRLLGTDGFDDGPLRPVEVTDDLGRLLGHFATFEAAIANLRAGVGRALNRRWPRGWVIQTASTRIYAHVACGKFRLSNPQPIKRGRRRTAWQRLLDADAE